MRRTKITVCDVEWGAIGGARTCEASQWCGADGCVARSGLVLEEIYNIEWVEGGIVGCWLGRVKNVEAANWSRDWLRAYNSDFVSDWAGLWEWWVFVCQHIRINVFKWPDWNSPYGKKWLSFYYMCYIYTRHYSGSIQWVRLRQSTGIRNLANTRTIRLTSARFWLAYCI